MKLYHFAPIVIIGFLPASASSQDQPPKPALVVDPKLVQADLDKLQGTWNCVSRIYDGRRDPENGQGTESIYEGNELTLKNQGQEYRRAIVTLNPTRSPKAMNSWTLDGPLADRTNRGIYEFDGEKLKVCFALDDNGGRPTEFDSQPGSKRLSLIYERRKP